MNDLERSLDLAELRGRYASEREKRLKVQTRGEYIPVEGSLADRFDRDVWVKGNAERPSVRRELQAVIVGGGFAGMIAACQMRRHGVAADQICIVERGADFGGTWYWNRYPGLACDTEAYCYLPLLEETGYIPKEKYAGGPELFEHSQRLGRHYGLYDEALFQTRVTHAEWNEDLCRWIVRTDRDDALHARFLWLCAGSTNRPKLPGVPGIEEFSGHCFHTMRWDYQYTGGSPQSRMDRLSDQRVGVIGTGCTAIQCVPPLAEAAQHLYVFQRTPSAVNVRANRPTDPAWAAALKPNWQLERMENFLNVIAGSPQDVDLVDDAWTWSFKNVRRVFESDNTRMPNLEEIDHADYLRMEEVRARVDAIVHDKATAEALKPWYGVLCKRPTFHDEYLQTFNRPNVSLVDTHGAGVQRVTRRGIIANGREYNLDCIIFSTGFDLSSGLAANIGFDPAGVGGLRLSERLRMSFTTLHGLLISGFPNMFLIGGAQGTLATTRTYDITVQTDHCARIVDHACNRRAVRFEVKPEAEAAWQSEMANKRMDHDAYFAACTPGYLNFEGKGGHVYDYYYGAGPVAYRRQLDQWRDRRIEEDLLLTSGQV